MVTPKLSDYVDYNKVRHYAIILVFKLLFLHYNIIMLHIVTTWGESD